MPAERTLKYREKGQNTQEEVRSKDREGLRRELEERERNNRDKHRPSSDTKRITSGGTTNNRSKPSIAHTETNIDAEYVNNQKFNKIILFVSYSVILLMNHHPMRKQLHINNHDLIKLLNKIAKKTTKMTKMKMMMKMIQLN